MTVAAAAAKAGPYTGNDSASAFDFAFKVFADTDIRVVATVIATGVESDLVLNTDYTVARNVDQDNDPGGTVTYKVGGVAAAYPSTHKLTIVGDFVYEQPTDIPNGGAFFATVIENALDRLTLLIKQAQEKLERAVTVAVSATTDPADLIADLTTSSAAAVQAAADAQTAQGLAETAAANLPNAVTAGGNKFLKTNPAGDGWVYSLLQNLNAGANIASAATVDLTAATGNSPRITGTTATSAVTMNTGQQMLVVADGAWPLTYHATTNRLNTDGQSYICVAGDMILYSKDSSGVVHGSIFPVARRSRSVVRLNKANGYGSTNTVIRRFTNVVQNAGADITYADSAANGATFTITVAGVYGIMYCDQFNTSSDFGISLNSSQLTSGITLVNASYIVAADWAGAANRPGNATACLSLAAGDVIRAHAYGTPSGTNTALCQFIIARID